MHDLAHVLGQRVGLAPQAECATRYVTTHWDHPLGVWVILSEQAPQGTRDACGGVAVVGAPYERVHTPVVRSK